MLVLGFPLKYSTIFTDMRLRLTLLLFMLLIGVMHVLFVVVINSPHLFPV